MLPFAALLLLAPTIYAQSHAVQVVTVGDGGAIQFSPDTITADVGSQVEFQFFGPAHSVVQASFASPCQPFNNGAGFFAGMQTSGSGPNPTTFTITVNDTNPIWFYCAFPGHCQAGMVGVINQPSDGSKTLDQFRAAAANAAKSTTPAQQQGGIFGPFIAATNGTESSTSSASSSPSTAATSAAGTTAASPSGSSPVSSPSTAPSTTAAGNGTGSASGSTSPTSAIKTSSPVPTGGAERTQFTLFGLLAGLVAALI